MSKVGTRVYIHDKKSIVYRTSNQKVVEKTILIFKCNN